MAMAKHAGAAAWLAPQVTPLPTLMPKMKPATLLAALALLCGNGCASLATLKSDTVQINGRTVAYARSGSGSPTVIFESGLGDGKDKWSAVATQLAQSTTVLSYDRAGYGGSSGSNENRDAVHVVAELRALLQAVGVKPPYVLVGHSLGGVYMQYFARRFADEVAGLVLVESSHWDQNARMSEASPATMNTLKVLSLTMPPTMRAELEAATLAGRQVNEAPTPRTMPVIVLTGTQRSVLERGKFAATWNELQQEITATYHAEQIIASRSGHYVQNDQPELVIAAIKKVLAKTQAVTPAPQ
jgi:pimeloyl-ACP methyl ester carboxylesterase